MNSAFQEGVRGDFYGKVPSDTPENDDYHFQSFMDKGYRK